MKENEATLKEKWHMAESIDEEGIYKKLRYREVEKIGFYIRPLRNWFYPCPHCQQKLKEMMAKGSWILGNKAYEPMIELNTTNESEPDDKSFKVVEKRKATKEEIEVALPRRTWRGIALMAHHQAIRRPRTPHSVESCRPWSAEDDARLLDCYNRGDALAAIGAELGRSFAGVACRITTKGISRPRRKQKRATVWRLEEDNLIGSELFCRGRG